MSILFALLQRRSVIYRCLRTLAATTLLIIINGADGLTNRCIAEEGLTPATVSKQPTAYPKVLPGQLKRFKIGTEPGFPGRIAFEAKIGELTRIFIYDLDRGKVATLVGGPGNSTEPTWSPDGTRLAFVSDRDKGRSAIYIIGWDGSGLVKITPDDQVAGNPTWHPKGNQIIYRAEESAGRRHTNFFSVHVPSAGAGRRIARRLTKFEGRNITPQISPNGTLIAFTTNRFWPGWEICIWNVETERESCPLTGSDSYFRPSWSPDGKQLLYSFGQGDAIDIHSLSLSGRSTTEITNTKGRDYDGIFAPDSNRILFVSETSKNNFDLFALEIDEHLDKTEKILSSIYSIRSISWTPVRFMELEARRMKATEGKE